MFKPFLIVVFLIISADSLAQVIIKHDKTECFELYNYREQIIHKDTIYEDSLYVVRRTCEGEWGGTIWFRNKKSNIEYSSSATCPSSVTKFNDKFYVISNLIHLSMSTEIIEVENPDSLSIFIPPEQYDDFGNPILYHTGTFQQNSKKGTKEILKNRGDFMVLGTYVTEDSLIYIYSDYDGVYLGKILEGQIFKVKDLILGEFKFIGSLFNKLRNVFELQLYSREKVLIIRPTESELTIDVYPRLTYLINSTKFIFKRNPDSQSEPG